MKKLFTLFLMMLLPLMASADAVEIDGIYFNLDDDAKTAEVTRNPDKYSGEVAIPESVEYEGVKYSVISIAAGAFAVCDGLTSVTIPNSVTTIGESAFNYSGITSITIPNSVTSIGRNAFYSTVWYDNQPDGIVYAGKVLYSYKGTMPEGTTIDIEEGTLGITAYAFYGCSGLTSVTIPNSVTNIGEDAFCWCSGLTSITIPNSVTSIGINALSATAWYDNQPDGIIYAGKVLYRYKGTMPEGTTIDIEEGTLSITMDAFNGCSGLTSVTIPNSITKIAVRTFNGCSGLTSITIPNSVTSIERNAFSSCRGLTSITIPSSVTTIEQEAFAGCDNLTSITVDKDNKKFDSRDNCNAIIRTATNTLIHGFNITTIPNSVTTIGDYAFSSCLFREFEIPEGVKSIDAYAFNFCLFLRSIEIPKSVTKIGAYAFRNCWSLKDVQILGHIEEMGDGSFNQTHINISVFDENPSDLSEKAFNDDSRTDKNNMTGYGGKDWFYSNSKLFVPKGTLEKYQSTAGWKEFKEIVALEEEEEIAEDVIKITSAGQTTWCSAYDLDFTDVEGLKAYTATGYHRTKGTIWLTRVKEVPAGEGILLIGDEGEYKVPHIATTAYYANLMVGTVEAITINETEGEYTNYYLSNGASGVGFYKVNGSVDIKANRAYLPLLKNTVSSTRGFIGIDFDDDDEGTTGINLIENGKFLDEPSGKAERNIENDVYYNLQGQRVDNPNKGLYIKNGKKVLIK